MWIYFDVGAKRGSKIIAESENAGLVARNAYTYVHMAIVAGIVVTAVSDEIMMSHPMGSTDKTFMITAVGGPYLFFLGNQAFKWATAEVKFPPLSHFVGQILLGLIVLGGWWRQWQPLTVGMAATGALVATAFWEWFSLHGGWERWAPWMVPLFGRIPEN